MASHKSSLDNFEKYLREDELSENTIDSYLYTVWEYKARYAEFTQDNLLMWKNWLIDNHSVSTVNLRINGMNRYIDFIKPRKVQKLKRVKTMKTLSVENAMTPEWYSKLINGLTDDGDLRWVAYYQILARTGSRISEALRLTVSDLNKGFAVMKTKGKIRRIWLPKVLITDLKDLYKDAGPETYLIVNRYGKQMTSRGFAAAMQVHADRYGIPKERMHPHALRHYFALQFMKNNQDVTLLADLLGHSNLDTTMIYARKSAEEQQRILNQTMNW